MNPMKTLIILGAIASAFFLGYIAGHPNLLVRLGQNYDGGKVVAITLWESGSQDALVMFEDGNVHRYIVERPR